MPKITQKHAAAIVRRYGQRLVFNRDWNEFILKGSWFPTGYHTDDLNDAVATLLWEAKRRGHDVSDYSKPNPKEYTRFVAYVGDHTLNVGNDLRTAFRLVKEHSKRSGKAYLYDGSRDKVIAEFVHGVLTQETKQTATARAVKYQPKGPMISNPSEDEESYIPKCDYMIRRSYGDRFIYVKCPDRAHSIIDGHPRCGKHRKKIVKEKKEQSNPKRGTLIYAQVNRIIATKKQKHICDAECKRHGHRYFHDFTSSPKMYGLPNGDLLITTR